MKTNSFNNGTEGANITAANSTTSGDAIASLTPAGTIIHAYEAAATFVGAKGLHIQSVADTDTAPLAFTDVANASAGMRIYFYCSATMTPTTSSAVVGRLRSTSANAAIAVLTTARVLQVQNAAGATVKTMNTGTALTDGWYRLELRATRGTSTTTGSITAELFRVATSDTTPLADTLAATVTGVNAGTVDINTAQFGKPLSSGGVNMYIDEVAFQTGSTAAIGPYSGALDIRYPSAVVSNPGGWSQVGAGASLVATLGDADDATGIRSPDDPAGTAITLGFASITPNKAVKTTIRHSSPAGDGNISQKYDLMQGATVIATRTVNPVPVAPTDYIFTTTSGETSVLTSWDNLWTRATSTKVV